MGQFDLIQRVGPFPVVDGLFAGNHINAIYRAGWQAQFATGAFVGNHGMHAFCGTENGVDRTGLDTQSTADAGLLVDDCQ